MRFLAAAVLAATAAAQERDLTFHIDSHLALVRFQVSPTRDQPLTSLSPNGILLLEDGVPQKIAHFEGGRLYPRTVPVEVALLFDCSRSVRSAGSLNPCVPTDGFLDEFPRATLSIYAFSQSLVRIATVSRDAAALRTALNRVAAQEGGETALFQSILDTVRDTPRGGGALRMLCVVSDGEATIPGDELTVPLAAHEAHELGVAIFPVLPAAPGGVPAMREHIASVREYLDLAPASGEAIVAPATPELLPRILRMVADHIRLEYVAGYYPREPGVAHHVTIVWDGRNRGAILGGSRVIVP